MAQKEELVTGVTPRGPALWPKLFEPDFKYNADGTFTVKQRLSAEQAAPHIEKIDALMEKSYEAAKVEYASSVQAKAAKSGLKKKAPAQPLEVQQHLPYAETEDGDFIFSFKLDQWKEDPKTKVKTKRKPALFDGKRNPITRKLSIGSGTELRVSYIAGSHFVAAPNPIVYVTLYMTAVQLLKLVAPGSGSTGSEFDEDKDAFDALSGSDAFADDSEDAVPDADAADEGDDDESEEGEASAEDAEDY